ncbi:MAG: PhnD/SsuA/transferrin family substrate-binding protein [Pseudotabrizicola sp.]|uniref:phosphate/phosphite/phosphonate ABC transporter substrate-binding protein n=1 Tax=Pseudotabrizicola sp. TaxID=2939647 RepID=UPI0027212F9D|nr:PhnD/SsuA/transferrin family substrate-binding protein [Pseudotabrizicola sp.]MDO9637954.1 PhnD/SsuA/transferrin family substrate-binding protein [Pseudotabrizicola sp.]
MIASLGMYDLPPMMAANDALWSLIRDGARARGIAVPDALTRGDGAYWPAWQSPDLLLSQTCGLPFRAKLHPHVTLIGTPDYGVEGCPPGFYRSVLIAREDNPRASEPDFAPARLAINEPLSQSGWAAVYQHFHDLGLSVAPTLQTGGHRASALAVAEGRADFAAVDAVTWALLTRHTDVTRSLRVFGQTAPTPGLPLITAQVAQAAALFDCVAEAIAALDDDQRHTLCLHGLVRIPANAYLALPVPPPPAQFGGTV